MKKGRGFWANVENGECVTRVSLVFANDNMPGCSVSTITISISGKVGETVVFENR